VISTPHAVAAAEGPDCRIALYRSGKCLVQGKGAKDWVEFVLEPHVLQEARLGYETVHQPEMFQPHIGVDESGKGDFFGPMVVAAVYTDEALVNAFRRLNVRDSKTVTTDKRMLELDRDIRRELAGRFAVVAIGPAAYNRLYAKMRSVNTLLAWGHARAIENLLEIVPSCPRALADQFGPTHRIESALMQKGKTIKLDQRPKAEADPAVAAASILARDRFVRKLYAMSEATGLDIPKGASDKVRAIAVELVRQKGPEALRDFCKLHFRTSREVLRAAGHDPAVLGLSDEAPKKFVYRKKKVPES
jgi:ribonuclease HIII